MNRPVRDEQAEAAMRVGLEENWFGRLDGRKPRKSPRVTDEELQDLMTDSTTDPESWPAA